MAGTAKRLEGKVALVTGAARGIGFACARALADEGCSIALADIDGEGAGWAAASLQSRAPTTGLQCDVTSTSQVQSMVSRTAKRFGGLDILVANAGITKTADFLDMSEKDYDAVLGINLKGAFLSGQAAAKQMIKQNELAPGKGGIIINMSSVNALVGSPSAAAYNASKGGIASLTRSMASALAPHHIRVNAVGPGSAGSILNSLMSAVVDDEAAMARILARTPVGRPTSGDPMEIGRVVALLSLDAARYITGQTMSADGGRLASISPIQQAEAVQLLDLHVR